MQKQEKSRKGLVVGTIAAVVLLAVLLMVLLTQCVGKPGAASGTVATTTAPVEETYELYWNLDRDLYDGKSEAGLSSREPEVDGLFHIRFFKEGEEVTLRATTRKVVNKIESMDLMGLVFDEEGVIVDALDPDDMPLEMPGYMFYIQSTGGKVIKMNSSETLGGMSIMLEICDKTLGIWDMTGLSGPAGIDAELVSFDRVIAVQNKAGELTHVYIAERTNYFLSHEAECQHCQQTVTWYEWTRDNELPKRTGHYQLMNDIQMTAQHSMAADVKLCLDLNGKTVDGKMDTRLFSMHNSGTELAIMDTSEEQTGKLAGHGNVTQGAVLWVRSGTCYMYGGTLDGSDIIGTNGGTVMIDPKYYFYMHGGTIIGATVKAQPVEGTNSGWGYGAGGAVYVKGTMRMYGGTIKDGRAEAGYNVKNGTQVIARGIGGNIFLNTGSVLELQGGEILNGYAENQGGNIYADGTAELIISGGTISGGKNNPKVKNCHGGNISAGGKTVITMSGGTIKNGVVRKGAAGGNINTSGTFTMTGGTIKGGKAQTGGNVHVGGKGKVTISGGTITGGRAENLGGNLNTSGESTTTVRGGKISGGVAGQSGGNISVNVKGSLIVSGGTISGGVAKGEVAGNGGGNIAMVTDDAKLTVKGGTIKSGKAQGGFKEDGTSVGGDGGNINANRGTVKISGGTITGGEVTGNGGGIYLGSNSKRLTLSGKAKIYGNGTDIMRSAATAEGKSDIVVDGWKGNGDKGALVIDRLKGVAGSVIALPAKGKTLTETELALFTSARKILPLAINADGQLAFAEQVSLGEPDHIHCLCNGTYEGHTCADTGFVSVDADTFKQCWALKDNAHHVLGSINVCLTEDVTLEVPHFTVGHEINLCLHGHTVTLVGEGRLTANGTTGILNITDCVGTGTILADSSRTASMMTTYKGALNIYGGTIDASAIKQGTTNTAKVGAVLYVREGADRVNMYGGKLIGGEVYRGGAVYVEKGQFTMYGGEITGGTASIGGNVATSLGSFYMYGGKIHKGTATSNGAGVHIGNGTPDTLILGGSAVICDNGTEDIYLGQQVSKKLNYLVLDGWNGNGSNNAPVLNCRGAAAGSVVAQAKEGALVKADLAKLRYTDSTLELKLKDGKIVLAAPFTHEHCICGGKLANTQGHTCAAVSFTEVASLAEFKELFDENKNLKADAHVVLTANITLDGNYFADAKVLELCLNDKTLTMNDGRLYARNGGTLSVTACSDSGKITAGTATSFNMLYAHKGTVNLYAGTVDAAAVETATGNGAAVRVLATNNSAQDAFFNMFGGTIIGAKQANRGGAVYVDSGKFVMSGGTITGGHACLGGGVSVNAGVMEMSGGTITNCAAATQGTTAGTGGGANIQFNASEFIISGDAKIYGNTCDGKPQDVYMGKKDKCLTMNNWNGNGENGALVLSCRDAVAGSAVAQAKEGALTETDLAKLQYADTTYTLELKEGKGVLLVPLTHEHCVCGGKLANTQGHTCTAVTYTEVKTAEEFKALFDADCKLKADTNMVLTASFELDAQYFSNGKTWNLCLNGNTITLVNGGRLTANGTTGSLNIADCIGSGSVEAGSSATGSMMTTYKGTLNIYGGTINAEAIKWDQTNTANMGPAIYTKDAADLLNMFGGKIFGGEAYRGGAVYVEKGTFTMHDGEITEGSAVIGGNVAVNQGSFRMYGGKIYGGSATDNGDGVHIGNGVSDTLILSGSAMIYGNGTEDVYLGQQVSKNLNYLVLDGWNGNGSKGALALNAREAAAGSVVVQALSGQLTADDLAKVTYYNADFGLELNADGKGVLTPRHRHCLCVDGKTSSCSGHSKLIFVPVGSFAELKAAVAQEGTVNIYLTASFALEEDVSIGNKTVNLCLNDQTITCSSTNVKRLKATDGGTLNITACGNGKIATQVSQGLTLAGGNINLYKGTVDAKTVNGNIVGGAVYVNADGSTFTMHGGTIYGAANSYRGGGIYVNKGRFNMHGGTITEGHSTGGGAGVCVNVGHMTMTGGTITGNSDSTTAALKLGGGVCILTNADSFTLSGSAKIYGNTSGGLANDLYLGNKGKTAFYVILDQWNGNGTNGPLVFSTHRDKVVGTVVAQAKEGALTEADLAKLRYADTTYALELSAEGKITLKAQ